VSDYEAKFLTGVIDRDGRAERSRLLSGICLNVSGLDMRLA
jgi:hypothetical protein